MVGAGAGGAPGDCGGGLGGGGLGPTGGGERITWRFAKATPKSASTKNATFISCQIYVKDERLFRMNDVGEVPTLCFSLELMIIDTIVPGTRDKREDPGSNPPGLPELRYEYPHSRPRSSAHRICRICKEILRSGEQLDPSPMVGHPSHVEGDLVSKFWGNTL